jgi:hypothetical protein
MNFMLKFSFFSSATVILFHFNEVVLILVEKLTVSQQIKKFPKFYEQEVHFPVQKVCNCILCQLNQVWCLTPFFIN